MKKSKKLLAAFLITIFALTMILGGSLTSKTVFADDDDAQPTSIKKLDYSKRTVTVGKEFTLKAYTNPEDCDDDALIWSISNTKIIRFEDSDDKTGDDMEFVARKAGTATITCRIKGTKKSKSCKVTVKNSTANAKIVVDDTTMDVELGDWEDIEAKLVGGNYSNRNLIYKVKNTKIAIVKNGNVYGKKAGKTKITIKSAANPKITKTITVTVEEDD